MRRQIIHTDDQISTEEANNALLLSKVHEILNENGSSLCNSLLSSQYVDRVDAHFNLKITYNPVVQEYENFEEKTVDMFLSLHSLPRPASSGAVIIMRIYCRNGNVSHMISNNTHILPDFHMIDPNSLNFSIRYWNSIMRKLGRYTTSY